MIRKPAVAGQFYPSIKEQLIKQIEGFIDRKAAKHAAIGCVLPHAGYIYSGLVAGQTISTVDIPENILLLGPNHTGLGKAASVMKEGSWQTPLGEVSINTLLANKLLESTKYLSPDIEAHRFEHCLEVELPFLQYFRADFNFVPIVFFSLDLCEYRGIAQEISQALKQLGIEKKILIIASSDMTHYEEEKSARKKDQAAIEAILALDEERLLSRIHDLDISMCGYAPTAILIALAKELGYKKAKLIKYQTSAEASGDYSSVVGYAGITIY